MRKTYGYQPPDDTFFSTLMPSVGDPDFSHDAQNNDHFHRDAYDVPDILLDPEGDRDEPDVEID